MQESPAEQKGAAPPDHPEGAAPFLAAVKKAAASKREHAKMFLKGTSAAPVLGGMEHSDLVPLRFGPARAIPREYFMCTLLCAPAFFKCSAVCFTPAGYERHCSCPAVFLCIQGRHRMRIKMQRFVICDANIRIRR